MGGVNPAQLIAYQQVKEWGEVEGRKTLLVRMLGYTSASGYGLRWTISEVVEMLRRRVASSELCTSVIHLHRTTRSAASIVAIHENSHPRSETA